MKTLLASALVLALTAALVACGSPTHTTSFVPGTYVMDVEKTQDARAGGTTLSGLTTTAKEAQTAALETQFAPDKYRFELRGDGSFALHMAHAAGAFVLEGTWQETETGIRLQASHVNGQPAEAETVPPEDVRVEDIWLVLGDADQIVYLRKQ